MPRGVYTRTVKPWQDRFWSKVDTTGEHWLWIRGLDRHGYGRFQVGSLTDGTADVRSSHVAAWELASGTAVPAGMLVCHTCDTPGCVRNDEAGAYLVNGIWRPRFGHLFLGTHIDNGVDMAAKGRARGKITQGEDHSRAVLTEVLVRLIRQMHADGVGTRPIARELGVSRSAVMHVLSGRSWHHVA